MAWRRISACPERSGLPLTQQGVCFWLIREPEADRFGYSARPMGLGVTVPSGRQAGRLKDRRDRRSLQTCRSGSHQSKERASEPEVDAGEVHPTIPHPSFHRSWGKRRRRQWTNPGSSRPPGPILKMGATAQAAPRNLSGPALAGQNQPSSIMRRGEADDLGEAVNFEIRSQKWGRHKPSETLPQSFVRWPLRPQEKCNGYLTI